MKQFLKNGFLISVILMGSSVFNHMIAQADSTKAILADTTKALQVDTVKAIQADTVIATQTAPAKQAVADTISQVQEKSPKNSSKLSILKDEVILYAGVNFNQLFLASDNESITKMGYQFGGHYKRGKFFYWQAGVGFNHAVYGFEKLGTTVADTVTFAVNRIDVPLTGGINVLSAVNRVVALRLFVSAVPSFVLGVGDNDNNLEKDDLNSFILYGQAGVGVNVAFLVIEGGFNYGFQHMIKDVESTPGQVFINLGFRF